MKQSFLLLICGIPLGAFFFNYARPDNKPTTPEVISSTGKDLQQCTISEVKNFELSYQSKGTLKFKKNSKQEHYNTLWSGLLTSTCINSNTESNTYYLKLSVDSVKGNIPIPIKEISHGIYAKHFSNRLELAASYPASPTARNIWLDIASINFACHPLQVKCNEYNMRGSYIANYERENSGYTKQYRQTGVNNTSYQYTIVDKHSELTLNIDQKQLSSSLSYSGSTNISLSLLGKTTISDKQLSILLGNQKLIRPMNMSFSRQSMKSAENTNWSIENLWSSPTLDSSYPQIVKWLQSLEQIPTELIDRIETTNDTQQQKFWLRLLAKVGTENSQKALRNFIELRLEDQHSTNMAKYALVALGMSDSQSLENIDFLKRISNQEGSLQKHAIYTLGTVASKQPAVQGKILDHLQNQLNITTDKEKSVFIRAIGNTRAQDILPILTPFLNSDDGSITKDAIFALRFDRTAFPYLKQQLTSENHNTVIQSIRSISYQLSSESSVKEILNTIPNIKNHQNRLSLLATLARTDFAKEKVSSVLSQFIETTPNEKLRANAQSVLDNLL